MELFSGLTDDQTALVGCLAALAACGGLLALSNAFGRRRAEQPAPEVSTLKFSPQAVRSRRAVPATAEAEAERRAA